jgi:hypothetical protein
LREACGGIIRKELLKSLEATELVKKYTKDESIILMSPLQSSSRKK